MSKFCLILSSIYDFSVDLVIYQLEKKGIDYLRLNKEHLSDYRINIDPISKTLSIQGLGIERVIRKITSIWYRQPVFIRNTPSEKLSLDEQLSRSQWSAFLRGLMIFDDSLWLNWPANTYSAESKPYQLMIASRVGFLVPNTQIGNDSEILNSVEGKVIVKSLDTVLLRDGDDCLFTYTSNVNKEDLVDENVRLAPLTVQSYITPKIDIRVTVIGDKIVAVKILSKGLGIDNDWRLLKKDELEYVDITLPDEMQRYCFDLMSELGLVYGAIDLIERDGIYYFIEINPTGEWGWLSNKERLIEKDIANLLSSEQVNNA